MNRLIDIDSDVKLEPEPKGHEYGYYIFQQLPSITKKCSKFNNAICTINSIKEITTVQGVDIDLDCYVRQCWLICAILLE